MLLASKTYIIGILDIWTISEPGARWGIRRVERERRELQIFTLYLPVLSTCPTITLHLHTAPVSTPVVLPYTVTVTIANRQVLI